MIHVLLSPKNTSPTGIALQIRPNNMLHCCIARTTLPSCLPTSARPRAHRLGRGLRSTRETGNAHN